jgi:hypothetical protein
LLNSEREHYISHIALEVFHREKSVLLGKTMHYLANPLLGYMILVPEQSSCVTTC